MYYLQEVGVDMGDAMAKSGMMLSDVARGVSVLKGFYGVEFRESLPVFLELSLHRSLYSNGQKPVCFVNWKWGEYALSFCYVSCVVHDLNSRIFQRRGSRRTKLLEEIDANMWSDTKHIEGRLIIDNGRRVRELKQETWMKGVTKSFSRYLSPARERGTKMLKIKNKLWLYTPQTDRKILISGHLLRQSMMGSDLSYEDMMEDVKVSRAYQATLEGYEDAEGKQVAILELKAKKEDSTYQTRKVWADPERYVVLKEIRYAKSGKPLKLVEFLDYHPIEGRLFPRRMVFRDL